MTTKCARCGGPVVEIVIGSGESKLTMRSCSTCESRQWDSDGEPVELDEVLGEINTTGLQRRNRRTF